MPRESTQFKKGEIHSIKGRHWKLPKENGLKKSKLFKGKSHLLVRGKNHWNWKGGNSRNYKNGYYSLEYKKWRLEVFIRDNFTCQNCRAVGGYFPDNSIKSFAKYPALRFDINNGITLCEDCHKLTDNYKGRNKNNSL